MLFWPDLATCHYGKSAKEFYNENGVNIVPKNHNPPNCPELRPVETYWAHIKKKLKNMRCEAPDINIFKRKWNIAANSITEEDVRNLMKHVNTKVRKFYRNAV